MERFMVPTVVDKVAEKARREAASRETGIQRFFIPDSETLTYQYRWWVEEVPLPQMWLDKLLKRERRRRRRVAEVRGLEAMYDLELQYRDMVVTTCQECLPKMQRWFELMGVEPKGYELVEADRIFRWVPRWSL